MAIQVCGRTKDSVRIVRSIFDNVDLEETTPLISFRSAYAPTRSLARIQLDDQLFVDDRLHFFAGRNVGNFTFESVAIDGQPIGNWNNLRKLEVTHRELARFRFVFDRDLVPCFHIVGSDVHAAVVNLDVAVRNELTRGVASVGETEPINHVVESGFEKLKQRFTGHAAFAQRVLENPAELALEKTVLVTKLLFFAERDRVFGLFSSRAFRAMHPGRIIFSLERFRWSKNLHAEAAADLCLGACVSSHGILNSLNL